MSSLDTRAQVLSPLSLWHLLFFPQVGQRRGGGGWRCGGVGKAAEARQGAGGGVPAAGRTAAAAWAAGLRWGPRRPPVG